MKITASLQHLSEGSDGCFCVRDEDNRIIGHMNIHDAQNLADSINVQLMDHERGVRYEH